MRLARSPPLTRRGSRNKRESSPNLTDVNTAALKLPPTAVSVVSDGGGGEKRGRGDKEGKKEISEDAVFKTGEKVEGPGRKNQSSIKGAGSLAQADRERSVEREEEVNVRNPETVIGECGNKKAQKDQKEDNDDTLTSKSKPSSESRAGDEGKSMVQQSHVINASTITVTDTSYSAGSNESSETTPEVRPLDSDVYRPWGSRSPNTSLDPGVLKQGELDKDRTMCRGGPGKPPCGVRVKDDDAMECDRCMRWFHV